MANAIWIEEDKKYTESIKNIKVPNGRLDNVDCILLESPEDFDAIPKSGGCYWIWTNEPVLHSLHKNKTPAGFDNGEIIYNGIAKDNVHDRVLHHLSNSDPHSGWSGISLDIYFGETISHRKKGLSLSGKVPYIKETTFAKRSSSKHGYKKGDAKEIFKPIRSLDDLKKIHLSATEKQQLLSNNQDVIHFRNGINIFEEKHKPFRFKIYWITGISFLYLDYIEKKWRELYDLPKLCSYSSGR